MKTSQHILAELCKFMLGIMLIGLVLTTTQTVFAVGETATKFGMFVPPNGDHESRDPMLVVTAVQDNTTVDIVDDSADGDSDDSTLGVTLSKGQSYLTYIQDGAVNDDLGGKADGDYFRISSNLPVLVANLTANSNWAHDFLPADNRRMSGTSFYLYRPPGFYAANNLNQLLNLFAYSNNTRIQIIDITDTAKTDGGITSVVSDAAGSIIFSTTLNAGEDLQEVHGHNVPLPAGHTFHIISNKDITAMFGALSKDVLGSEDGGSYVPGKNGTSADRTFYFAIPYKDPAEREMRLVSYEKAANVTVRGWNVGTAKWDIITTLTLPKYGHAELIGNELGSDFYFFEVIADETISIFETSWLETGDFGTSDIMTFISASDGQGAGTSFLAYMGPPAIELANQLSHLYVYSYEATSGVVYDADNYGEYIELYNNSGKTLNLAGWSLVNGDGYRLTIPAGKSVAAGQTFLLEFHQGASDATADFVYGTLYPNFKLGNGSDTITLVDAAGTAVDTLTYAPTGWGNHGVYTALERKNPNLPFTASNARDSETHHADTVNNLGDYYGTPDLHNGTTGTGTGTGKLVINELMTGRIYQPFTIAADGFYDFSLTVDQWLGLHSGDNPGSGNGLENPYLIVETTKPVSVMNANWNDNWMAYGTSILQPEPIVNHTANYYERGPGESVIFSTYVSNDFNTLYSPVTTIHLPPGIDYTPGSYTTPSQLSGVTPNQVQNGDGSWTLTWSHGKALPEGDVYFFQVMGSINSGVSNGTLLQSTAHTSGQDSYGSTYASQDSAIVNVGFVDESTLFKEVVINELLPNASCGAEMIEIHNRSTSAVNIGGWELSDEDGFIYTFPADTFIPNDGYLVVSLSNGVDDGTYFYTGEQFALALGDSEDQVALYNSSTHSIATLVDFVQWGTGTLQNRTDDDTAVLAGQWQNNLFIPAPAADQSLGRDRNASDSDSANDWENSGGVDSAGPSFRAINISIPGEDATAPPAISNVLATAVANQEGTVQLNWTNPTVGDLAGVRILRSNQSTPARLSDGQLVYDGLGTTFTDTGLIPGQPVFYALFAYDDAGNLSCPHANLPTKAVPPQDVYIAIEDLKGWRLADWDMNDLIVHQSTAVQVNNVGVTQLEIVMEPVARGGRFDHTLYLGINFNGSANITQRIYNKNGTLRSSSSTLASNGTNIVILESTLTELPPNALNSTTNAVSGMGRVNGPRIELTISLNDPAANPLETFQEPPFDPWIWVADTQFSVHMLDKNALGNTQKAEGGPLHGRDLPFIVVFEDAWQWPEEETPIWEAYPDYVNYIISNGQLATDWMNNPQVTQLWSPTGTAGRALWAAGSFLNKLTAPEGETAVSAPSSSTVAAQPGWPQTTGGYLFASPLIVDLDGDNQNELIAAANNFELYVYEANGSAAPGWPRNLLAYVRSSPAVGDIDGDGDLEIVIGTDNGKLHAYHHNGTAVSNFPLNLNHGAIKASPTLAQLDGDAALEIIVHTSNGYVHILNGNGANFSSHWPQQIGRSFDLFGSILIDSSAAVGDMDADNVPEIVVGSTDGKVYAWHLDGRPLSALWPQQTGDWIYASPIIVDLNEDGFRDVVALSGDGRIYAWRGEGTLLDGFPIATQSAFVASPAVADVDNDGDLELFVVTLEGDVLGYSHDGQPLFNWPKQMDATTYSSPIIGDIDGDRDLEIMVGNHNGRLYGWHHDGIPINGWPLQTDDWIVGTPTLGDLDKDGDIEIAVGTYGRKLHVWDEAGTYDPETIRWLTLGSDMHHSGFVATSTPIQPLPEVIFSTYIPMVTR